MKERSTFVSREHVADLQCICKCYLLIIHQLEALVVVYHDVPRSVLRQNWRFTLLSVYLWPPRFFVASEGIRRWGKDVKMRYRSDVDYASNFGFWGFLYPSAHKELQNVGQLTHPSQCWPHPTLVPVRRTQDILCAGTCQLSYDNFIRKVLIRLCSQKRRRLGVLWQSVRVRYVRKFSAVEGPFLNGEWTHRWWFIQVSQI